MQRCAGGDAAAGMAGAGAGAEAGDEAGQPDAVLLAPLSEDTFLHNLHVRYKQDIIYTYVGNSLVSVNPCRALPLYSAELVRAYLQRPPYTLPPHIYAVAATAYRWARDRGEYQCIVMTGESGAGKTEAARVCLQCVVLAGSGGAGSGGAGSGGAGSGGAGAALTAAGTLLEAFGNAATARNHNASRFGKLVDVTLDVAGTPCAGHVSHFLLEKSRASGAGVCAGERNFHVFYQLLAGADAALLKRLRLQRSWEAYGALCGGRGGRGGGGEGGAPPAPPASPAPPDRQDRDHFAFTKAAMASVGVGAGARGGVWRVLAFMLKLSNVGFEPHHNIDGSLGARLTHKHELEEACALVGVCARSLAAALGAAPHPAPHVPECGADESESDSAGSASSDEGWGAGGADWCRARRDRLLHALYARLFAWLVSAVNARLAGEGGAGAGAGGGTLGLLDVYGLEALAHNGLERLLINYAAERVQAAAAARPAGDQAEYARERLPYDPRPLSAAPTAADLLDQGPESVLALIESSSSGGGGGGGGGGARLVARLDKRRHARLHALPPHHFQVVHFGGPVVYCARGMPGKNRDSVCVRAAAALAAAAEPLLRALFGGGGAGAGPGGGGSPRRGAGAGLAARQRALVSAALRRLPPQPRFVRCLRPDRLLRPHRFDLNLVRDQLRTQGIVEMALVRRSGWCEAMCARALLQRYGVLAGVGGAAAVRRAAAGAEPGEAVRAARLLLRALPIPSAEFAFGRSKVFIRSPRTVWELEALRAARVGGLVAAAQRAWRRHRARSRAAARARAQRVIARAWRGYRARRGPLRRRVHVRTDSEGARAWAARVVWRAWCAGTRRRYLLSLAARLPPRHASPVCAAWPACPWPALLAGPHALLRRLHHRWRCCRYRRAFDQTARNRMREKVTASVLFRERKALYCASVAHPFVGDYVRLRASGAWRRGPGAAADRYVVFADVVRKLARAGTRTSRVLCVLSTHALLLLDCRSLRVKRRVPAHLVYRLSLSPHTDDLLAVHVRACGNGSGLESSNEDLSQCSSRDAADAAGCLFGESRRRGDVVLRALHVLELATKLFLVVQNACGAPPAVAVAGSWECSPGGASLLLSVHPPPPGQLPAPRPRLQRRGSRLDVLL